VVSDYKYLAQGGYSQNKVFLIDDFRKNDISFNYLLKLLDRYPINISYKGGSIDFNSEYIFITTPKSIKETFGDNGGDDVKQLERRVYEIDISKLEKDFKFNVIDFESLENYKEKEDQVGQEIKQDDFDF